MNILPTANINTWEHIFEELFAEWNIDYNIKVTAVTYATAREEIIQAMQNKGFTLIPCLDYTIRVRILEFIKI